MKQALLIALMIGIVALIGCSTEKTPAPIQQTPAITLTPADKEKLIAFKKDILNIETLTDKAVKMAGDELKNVITGRSTSINMSTLIEKAKSECLLAGETLVKKKVPETLPPELAALLNDGKNGLASAYKAYAESYDAIRSFITDKNPIALLEYRKKNSQARELYNNAADKFKIIMTSAGVTK